MIPPCQEKAPWGWNLAFLMMNFEHILWKLLQTPCRWLEIYHNFALAQLTDKMDHMYIIPKEASDCHTDAHVKKILSAILDFWENGKKTPFSAVSQHPDHIEGWLFWWKLMASLHIGHNILISHLVLHYFRYKMAAEICQYIWGSSSAHRLDGPHVLYIKMTVWVPW